MGQVAPHLPFAVDRHPWAQGHMPGEMTRRLQADAQFFAEQENASKEPQLKHLLTSDIEKLLSHVPRAASAPQVDAATAAKLEKLEKAYKQGAISTEQYQVMVKKTRAATTAAGKATGLEGAIQHVDTLIAALRTIKAKDDAFVGKAVKAALERLEAAIRRRVRV